MKEILKPLKSPLSGWRRPKPYPEVQPKPQKERLDDPVVHQLLGYLREKIGAELDGDFKANYAACKELCRRCTTKGNDPIGVITALVDVALEDPFHGKNTTTYRYLLNHGVQIFRAHKERFTKPASKLDQALRRHDERRASQQYRDGADPFIRDPSTSTRDQEAAG